MSEAYRFMITAFQIKNLPFSFTFLNLVFKILLFKIYRRSVTLPSNRFETDDKIL